MEPKLIDLKLLRIKSFLQEIGNPQEQIKYRVHIAGTNGKGSTLAFLEALLLENTYLKIGKYTSPHLLSIQERFQLSQDKKTTEQISFTKLKSFFRKFSFFESFRLLSPFEKLTAIAFAYFSEVGVELILLETGLGGRLDATNVFEQVDLCLFTNISLEHTEYLGETKEQIALEKGGILKFASPWLSTLEPPENLVLKQLAQEKNAPEISLKEFDLTTKKLDLRGDHQRKNAQLAINALYFLCENKFKQKELKNFSKKPSYQSVFLEKKSKEARKVIWAARFEDITSRFFKETELKIFAEASDLKIILDGAHNHDSAKQLAQTIEQEFFDYQQFFLIGFSREDELKQKNILRELIKDNSNFADLILTELGLHHRKLSEHLLFSSAQYSNNYLPKFEEALGEFKSRILFYSREKKKKSVGIITGSLYLAGKVLSF